MHRYIFAALLVWLTKTILLAQVVGNPGFGVGQITFDSCASGTLVYPFNSLGEVPVSTDIEFGPDGELFILSPFVNGEMLSDESGVIYAISELDYRSNTTRKVVFVDSLARRFDGFVSLGNNGSGTLISVVEDTLVSINISTGEVSVEGVFSESFLQADITTAEGLTFFTTNLEGGAPGIVAFENNSPDEIRQIVPFEGSSFSAGLGTAWSNDCSEKLLVCSVRSLVEPGIYRVTPQLRRTNSDLEVVAEGCSYEMNTAVREVSFGQFFGVASYDNYISVCDLKIDLDADDSGSRFGPHFWQDVACTTSYPIADADVKISSLVGAIDSITVKLRTAGSQPGFDLLKYPANTNLEVRNLGDTLLHIVGNELVTDNDFLEILPQISLNVNASEVVLGERIVEVHAYAGGLKSDQARAFIQVNPFNGSNAGRDTTVVVCEGGRVNLLEALGPGTTAGGSWFPFIPDNNQWIAGEAFYDIPYEYSVGGISCSFDTSYVTVVRPQPIKPMLPIVDTTIALCPGKTFYWNIDLPDRRTTVIWDDGTFETTRSIVGPGVYTGRIGIAGSCQPLETISLTVVTDTLPEATSGVEFYCHGDTVQLADGGFITSDSLVVVTYVREEWSCDSLHSTQYYFRDWEQLTFQDTLCSGEKIVIRDYVFEEPGVYEFLVSGEQCDTLVEVTLYEADQDTVRIDTILAPGETLVVAEETFFDAGTYQYFSSTTGPCGTFYEVTLDFSTSAYSPGRSPDFWYPSVLRHGTDVLDFHAIGASNSLQIEQLRILDLQGRVIAETAEPWSPDHGLPAGIYFFQVTILLDGTKEAFTGKLLVFNASG